MFYRVKAVEVKATKKCGRNALIYRALSSEHHNVFDVALTDQIIVEEVPVGESFARRTLHGKRAHRTGAAVRRILRRHASTVEL